MPTLKEMGDELVAKRGEIAALFTKHRNTEGELEMPLEVVEDVRRRNEELNDLDTKFQAQKSLHDMEERNRLGLSNLQQLQRVEPVEHERGEVNVQGANLRGVKSLGELFTETDSYKSAAGRHGSNARYSVDLSNEAINPAEVAVKTTMTLTAGFAAENQRRPLVVDYALRRPVVADLIPQTEVTGINAVRYMEITTFTNAAAPVAENAAKPESALAATERTVPIEVIATYLPVTNQQLDDVPMIRQVIDNQLRMMLLLTEETQLLSGSGTTPQLTGFYNKSGIQTQAKGADDTPTAIFKAMQKVRSVGFAEPSGVVLHPDDWTDIRTLKTVDGIFIWGSPAEAGPERIWGKPVIITTAATSGTGLTGDFSMWSHITRRMGITIEVGFINDDLIKNKRTILAEERLALEIYRAAAFATITGI